MERKPVGMGLIGVGRHGLRYARHMMEDLPTASLKAVCRLHPERGLDLPGAESVRVYGEARSLIADPSVEVVVVVTPPIFSRDICQLAIAAHKPVLVEKPLATNASDARAIVEAARAASVPLMTGQTLRFDSTVLALKARRHLVGRSKRLALTSHIETRATGPDHADGFGKRGALLEIGVHMLDLVRFLTGEEVRDVRCTMDPLPPALPEIVASAQLETRGGTLCSLDVARVPEGRVGRAEWIGSEGVLEADWIYRRLRWQGGVDVEEWEIAPSHTVPAALAAFLQAVETGAPVPVTGKDGCRAVEMAEACYRSAEAGGAPVTLQERG
ncbi:MAG TPA: Gfo/Idh/MocA family oxidoreductase [Nitrospira sp.]|nr:Gfo/Idh/MocA family oxidoreductase [Nitrospira sp.]